jgi:ATP-dependent helicase/nuclease subunit B
LLLGPAGSGKTFQCVAEARAELLAAPDGLPLLFLAPKQATFQLERQLLADPALGGYCRLHIVSFERLTELLLTRAGQPPPPMLSEEGRLMVLRALLTRRRPALKVFHATARLPGFAQQVNALLREFQQHRLSAAQLERLADRAAAAGRLSDKLRDLAFLMRAFQEWLHEHRLEDAQCLLDLAAAVLAGDRAPDGGQGRAWFGGLWLDGFAALTPQELELLAALAPRCEKATLAFCVADMPAEGRSWLSPWFAVSQTCSRVCTRLSGAPGVEVFVERLPRLPRQHRFRSNPVLQHLERHWDAPVGFAVQRPTQLEEALRVIECANPEAEVILAARAILRFVREEHARFRDVAVLTRSLGDYADLVRRVFSRYGIPFFLDRREPVAHHPLAELTRYALRAVTFGWQHDDWFGALKSGLADASPSEIDRLENEALARGWRGDAWQTLLQIPDNPRLQQFLERLRQRLAPAFLEFKRNLSTAPSIREPQAQDGLSEPHPTGAQLARAVRQLWRALDVERQLSKWTGLSQDTPPAPGASRDLPIHATVWEQMNSWVDNLELAFEPDALTLPEWLPVLESGLSNLTVGVIPPALDQVLVGAIDRSRNPELKLAILLGLNESVFPASPPSAVLLTEADRETLAAQGVELGPDRHRLLGCERYFGYIACTRPSQRLVLTCSERAADDRVLNRSPFIAHLQRLFPGLTVERPDLQGTWAASEHVCELAPALVRLESGDQQPPSQLHALEALMEDGQWPGVSELAESLASLGAATRVLTLSPQLAERLYGPFILHTSVSDLEQFAACPFKFFVKAGLAAGERQRFEVDSRRSGSFLHDVLARFHQELRNEGRRWRDVEPAEARERIARIAREQARAFGEGVFQADEQTLFTAQSLTLLLQDLIETVVTWARAAYDFDPAEAELSFGRQGSRLPPWELDLEEGHRLALRGVIDRVDLATIPNSDEVLCAILDYKSSAKKVDPLLLAHGIQMQLPAYLAAMAALAPRWTALGPRRLRPAGFFYVPLQGEYRRGASRQEVVEEGPAARFAAYQHRGRFDRAYLWKLDQLSAQGRASGQFSYPRPGRSGGRSADPMNSADFLAVLGQVETQIKEMGRRIFAGTCAVDPYARSVTDDACRLCDFQSICRIDPWVHEYRRLWRQEPGAEPED